MAETLDPEFFDGLSVYQDVLWEGRVIRQGVRDCRERWELISPHVPQKAAVLDIGSNFGWFGLKICESCPQAVVASVEADPRSALIQRQVLASHEHRRLALLTARANCRLVERFARRGQRFDVALCLSILHWMPDHQEFLQQLGKIADRIIVEYPHPAEPDAGSARIRREIGEIGPYLARLFPARPVAYLGDCATHLDARLRRPIWLVDSAEQCAVATAAARPSSTSVELDFAALVQNGLSWPPRSWWEALAREPARHAAFAGLSAARLRSLLAQVPEQDLYGPRGRWRRQVRQAAGRWARRSLAWMH
ncbi:MAG: class I SAM-dependent methyltransferase [Planctomycetaceae bacterium]|nr:class I SAM-dependent methyltransferase [Planctomycetaceae bacterium]